MAIRLNVLMGNLLLILSEINHKDIHSLSEGGRKAKGKELIALYFKENQHILYRRDDDKRSDGGSEEMTTDPTLGTLKTIEEYVELNKKLQAEVLAHFDIDLNNAPTIPDSLIPKVFERKVFYVGVEG